VGRKATPSRHSCRPLPSRGTVEMRERVDPGSGRASRPPPRSRSPSCTACWGRTLPNLGGSRGVSSESGSRRSKSTQGRGRLRLPSNDARREVRDCGSWDELRREKPRGCGRRGCELHFADADGGHWTLYSARLFLFLQMKGRIGGLLETVLGGLRLGIPYV
jgi:hypothetical protein